MGKLKRQVRISKYVIYRETLVDPVEHFWSFIGAFFGIGVIAYIQSFYFTQLENVFLIGSFGASSVLIYGAIQSPLAQPRNVIGGHVFSAFIGVTVAKIIPEAVYISAPLAVATSIVVMQMTKTLHPPGGATALIAVSGGDKIVELGYYYVFSPVLTGTLLLLFFAIIFNNLTKKRHYPANFHRSNLLTRWKNR